LTYLLDTNTCIEYLNGRSRRVVERLQSRMPEEIVVCSVVKAELRYGAERSRNPLEAFAELDEFLTPYRSLPFDDECARVYGQIRAQLAHAGALIWAKRPSDCRHSHRIRRRLGYSQYS